MRTFAIDLQNVYFTGLERGRDKLKPGIYKFHIRYSEADLNLVGLEVVVKKSYSNKFQFSRF